MKPILFSLFGNQILNDAMIEQCGYEMGEIVLRPFPDEETYVKINTDVKNHNVVFIANLERPNNKILPLLFAAQTAHDLGAKEIGLIVPYLVYMRQDKQFSVMEGITSKYFAALLSNYFNWLMTIDPHLHRLHSLSEIYSIPTIVLHAINPIVQWIKHHVDHPIIIGPDQESKQWVESIAKKIDAPFLILEKIRKGDRSIEVSLPQIEQFKNHTPVLVDDIISSGRTMIEPVRQLRVANIKPPVCIGVHAVFAENAYEDLLEAGAGKVVTCNTIPHSSNAIDVSSLVINFLKETPIREI